MSSERPLDPAAPAGGDLVVVGRLMRPFGVRGEIRLRPVGEAAEWWFGLAPDRFFLIRNQESPVPVRVRFTREHGGFLLVELEGVETPEAAKEFCGGDLAVPESDRPAPRADEFYVDQLLGLRVVGPDGEDLGAVVDVIESPAGDFLAVQRGAERFLLPPDRSLIQEVNLEERIIRVNLQFESS
ncbi:MAG: ribosome maturation factor RimM [Candidatus Sumerlaeota bacterium]|nr:ribosome maturation factor RimM [Candidatus Sumerlaeota bacterium]